MSGAFGITPDDWRSLLCSRQYHPQCHQLFVSCRALYVAEMYGGCIASVWGTFVFSTSKIPPPPYAHGIVHLLGHVCGCPFFPL